MQYIKNSKKTIKSTLTIALIILIAGVIFLTVGIIFNAKGAKFRNNGETTTAVIKEISTEQHNGDYYNVPYVLYVIDGVTYYTNLSEYFFTMKVGDEVEIIYLKNDPTQVILANGNDSASIFSIFVGAVLIIIGVVFLFNSYDANEKLLYLMENGKRVSATITEFTFNPKIEILNRNPATLRCVDGNGVEYVEKFLYDGLLPVAIGMKVSVYVDLKNSKKYKIDVTNFSWIYSATLKF